MSIKDLKIMQLVWKILDGIRLPRVDELATTMKISTKVDQDSLVILEIIKKAEEQVSALPPGLEGFEEPVPVSISFNFDVVPLPRGTYEYPGFLPESDIDRVVKTEDGNTVVVDKQGHVFNVHPLTISRFNTQTKESESIPASYPIRWQITNVYGVPQELKEAKKKPIALGLQRKTTGSQSPVLTAEVVGFQPIETTPDQQHEILTRIINLAKENPDILSADRFFKPGWETLIGPHVYSFEKKRYIYLFLLDVGTKEEARKTGEKLQKLLIAKKNIKADTIRIHDRRWYLGFKGPSVEESITIMPSKEEKAEIEAEQQKEEMETRIKAQKTASWESVPGLIQLHDDFEKSGERLDPPMQLDGEDYFKEGFEKYINRYFYYIKNPGVYFMFTSIAKDSVKAREIAGQLFKNYTPKTYKEKTYHEGFGGPSFVKETSKPNPVREADWYIGYVGSKGATFDRYIIPKETKETLDTQKAQLIVKAERIGFARITGNQNQGYTLSITPKDKRFQQAIFNFKNFEEATVQVTKMYEKYIKEIYHLTYNFYMDGASVKPARKMVFSDGTSYILLSEELPKRSPSGNTHGSLMVTWNDQDRNPRQAAKVFVNADDFSVISFWDIPAPVLEKFENWLIKKG